MYSIGIDIGTSSICGVVCDLSGTCVQTVTRANETSIASSQAFERTQDPEAILALVEEIIGEFCAHYSGIRRIGITGQMHGVLYVDAQGRAVSPLYTWQDGRGNQPYRNGQTYAEYLSEYSGRNLATGWGLVTHFYNLVNGKLPTAAVRLCTVMDYVVMRLTGNATPLMDFTNAAGMGFFDARRLCFDTAKICRAGIDPSILPEFARPSFPAGIYRGTTQVFSAIGDNQAAFLGSVNEIATSVHVTVGTSSQISVFSETYIDAEGLETRPMPGGGYILVGAALCGGEAFALLKTLFEQTLLLFGGTVPDDMYAAMLAGAADPDGDLPIVEPLFRGTRAEPLRRGSISSLTASNITPGNLVTGVLQGIVTELYRFYTLLPPEVRQKKTQLVGSGNGLKKNPLLASLFERRFGLPLLLPDRDEAAAYGACIGNNNQH